jgi:hypothetical protein
VKFHFYVLYFRTFLQFLIFSNIRYWCGNIHSFKNRIRERTGKESGSRTSGPTGGRTGDVINNLINNFKII